MSYTAERVQELLAEVERLRRSRADLKAENRQLRADLAAEQELVASLLAEREEAHS